MKKLIVLLLVFLLVLSIPITAFAGVVRLYKIQVSAIDNHGELKNSGIINNQTYRQNAEIDLMIAEPFSYEGYYFIGWHVLDDPAIIANTKILVTQNCEYRAEFNRVGYQVAFDLQDGSAPSVEMKSFGDKLSEQTPTRGSLEFGGWYLDPQCSGERVVFPYTVHADVTFYAKWIGTYEVCFLDEEGQQIGNTQQVAYRQCADAPDDPKKEGHTFKGWRNGTETLGKEEIEKRRVTTDVNYTAEFSANLYEVCFLDEEGQQIGNTQQVVYRQCADAPDDPKKEGHTFKGWHNGTEMLGKEEIEKRGVTGDVGYTAMFETNKYVMTFVANGIAEKVNVEYHMLLSEPEKPTCEGYDFAGWLTDEGNLWRFGTDTMPASNITLYAGWDTKEYTVTFYEQDGFTPIGLTQKVNWGCAAVPETAPVITGYLFEQWELSGSDASETDSLQNVKENIDAVARYSRDSYIVTFIDDQGRVIGTANVYAGCSAAAPNAPEKEGYTFIGWDISFDNVTLDITVVAQYKQTIIQENNAATYHEAYNDVSDGTNHTQKPSGIKLYNQTEDGELTFLSREEIPASGDKDNRSSHGESIRLANRVSFLNVFSEVIIIVLGILTALALGVSICIVKFKKRY